MSQLNGHAMLARAFVAEGTDTVFTLMGDANMHWAVAIKEAGARLVHARHEHAACAMADGYARATGRVGVASVTCGPGFTQIMTALTVAARRGVPLVVFAGDTPTNAPFHIQQVDQAALTAPTGAHFMAVKSIESMTDTVREAFYIARWQRRPVVLSIPMDVQKAPFPFLPDYAPSEELLPVCHPVRPDPRSVAAVVEEIARAKRPIVLGGRGAVAAGAGPLLEALAERTGALLATSLLANGLFHENEFSIGIAGAYASNLARELSAECDLVIAAGAGLGYFTTEAGYLYPNARIVQIDVNPRGYWQGLRVADVHMRADAAAGVQAVLESLPPAAGPGYRSRELAGRLRDETMDSRPFDIPAGMVDPRTALVELDRAIPKDWDIVTSSGHQLNFVLPALTGRSPERFHTTNDFGAIGQGLSTAIGVAAARNDGKVLLIEGDGSLLMHIQELETLHRHGIKLLVCALNDGGYGAEAHKLRAEGDGPGADEAVHGLADLAGIAKAFGLNSGRIDRPGMISALLHSYQAAPGAALWDMRIPDFPSIQYRRIYFGES